MEFHVFVAVLFAAVLHAGWNAVIRRGGNRFQGMLLLTATQGVMAIAMAAFVPLPDGIVWVWVLGSGLVHTMYKLFLAAAYQHGDLSRVYPIARGAAPMIGVIVGFSVLADTMVVDDGLVENNHSAIHARKADLPIPRPDALAIFKSSGSSPSTTLRLFNAMCSFILRNARSCQARGPLWFSRGVPGWPQGKAYITKPSGSSWNCKISRINCCSSGCGTCFTIGYLSLKGHWI